MNNDIKKWLAHFKKSNKRKFNEIDDDAIVKELSYYCIKTIIKIVKLNKVNRKSLEVFFEGLKFIYNNTNKNYKTSDESSILLINGLTSISIKIIDDILDAFNNTHKFNLLKFLEDMKSEFFIPKKKRKINYIDMDMINIQNRLHDINEYDDDYDEDYDDDDEDFNIDDITDENVKKFLLEVQKISKNNNKYSDIKNYYSELNEKDKNTTLEQLKLIINESSDKMPYLFKILQTSFDNITKKNIINKILTPDDDLKNRKYIDDLMKIPFGVYKGIDISSINPKDVKSFLNNLTKLMDDAVYGHEDAKKQIVNIMAQNIRNPNCQGSVIGLWGVHGNGKTSLIKDGIAKAMDRPFIFISLGGAQDGSILEGHSYTYEGSIYGSIAKALMDAKCMNPIIYFDELDKVSQCHKGAEITNLLIHLIDPVQNKLFRDKYFYDIELDLSKVTFIFSFNDPWQVNYILRDRITIIETKFLTNEIKIHIAKNYLLDNICKDIGINKKDVLISEDVIFDIINNYTNEGGVRRLKEHLYYLIRELNKASLTKSTIANQKINFPIKINTNIYNELFNNKAKIHHLKVHNSDGCGMVNGLWANDLGQGGVLPIESVLIPSKDIMSIKATGSLGEVIKESIEVALSVAWNKLDELTKKMWMNKWAKTPECFHIHCPDGSTGKEGPSAGAAMTLAFYSRLINKKVKHTVAMTGEINLREEVTEIGGLDRKLYAAKRDGASLALIPFNNKIDLDNVIKNNPKLIDDTFKVVLVKNFNDVINHALIDY